MSSPGGGEESSPNTNKILIKDTNNTPQKFPSEIEAPPPNEEPREVYGSPDVNNMLRALKAKIGVEAFIDNSRILDSET